MKLETKAIHNGFEFSNGVNTVVHPIHLSTTFLRSDDGSFHDHYRYSRLDNPNRRALEKSIAQLEKGATAYAFSSGMAAISAIFQLLKSDDHILIPDDVFFNVKMLLDTVFLKFGISYTEVDMSNEKAVSTSIQDNTRIVWVESPSNPMLKLTDIAKISRIAKSKNVLVIADNTWYTPVLCNPIELGADIVLHSTTKYISGHSDVMGGALIFLQENELSNLVKQIQILSGAVPSPFDCWLILRGIKTLPLRVKQQSKTAMKLAQYLKSHRQIEEIYYPGLGSHSNHDTEKTCLKHGFGGMLSVLINGDKKNAFTVINNLKYFKKATSLGGVESLVEHRQSVESDHSRTPENLIRISVGLEHIDDLVADWDRALNFI